MIEAMKSQQDARGRVDTRQVAGWVAIFTAAAGVFMVSVYLAAGIWQYLAQAVLFWSLAIASVTSRYLVRRDRGTTAANLLVAASLLFIPASSLLSAGDLVPLVLVSALVPAVLIALVMPRKHRALLWGISVVMGFVVWGTSSLSLPWERVAIGSTGVTMTTFRAVAGSAIAFLVVWYLLRSYRRLVAIRTRLLATFIALVAVVAIVVSVTSILFQVRIGQQQAFDQLETTVTLKTGSVNAWIDQLQFALDSLVVEDYEVQRAQAILLRSLTEEFQVSSAQQLRVRFSSLIKRTGWFTEIFLISADGDVAMSTQRDLEGRNVSDQLYFQKGLDGLYLEPPRYDPITDGVTIVLARPLQLGGFTYGVLAGRTDMTQLLSIVAAGQLGETGTTDLVSADYMLLTAPALSGGYVPVRSDGIDAALQQSTEVDHSVYTNHRGTLVSGARVWLPRLQVALLAEQNQREVQSGALITSLISGGVGLLATLLAVLFALLFSNSISRPLSSLATVATRVAGGSFDVTADVEREDEIGSVARAFNVMTAQLRDLIGDLERRVEERTRGLQAVTEVSRAIASVLDPDQLLPQVVDLAQQRFDLYYVGLFLLDENNANAELRAGTGSAGVEMLARNWRLPIGGESMIGRCVATGEAVIRQQSVDDVVRFDNPLLPETRSELALPLLHGDRVIGAMTVQSTLPNAFDETDIAVLQNLADQVAVAVENAGLFVETQSALDRARRAQRRFERQQWSEYLGARDVSGYEQTGSSMRSLDRVLLPEVHKLLENDAETPGEVPGSGHQIVIPITQGDQMIGVLGMQRDAAWSAAETELVQTLVDQLSLAAENQRLLDVTQRREAAERLTREVTARMREPVELEDVLRTAADEIRQALGADWAAVRMVESVAGSDEDGGGIDGG